MVASIRFPYPLYLLVVVRRTVGIWLLARIAYGVVLLAGMAFFNLIPSAEVIDLVLHPAWPARALLVALGAGLVWWDRKRFHELLLPANLGAWSGWFWTASLLTALVLDVAIQTLLAAR